MKKIILTLLSFLYTLVLFAQDSTAYKTDSTENKFIYSSNTIKFFPGQRINISSKELNNKLVDLTLLERNSSHITDMNFILQSLTHNEQDNICLDYNIVKDSTGKLNTILIVNNPYPKKLSYKAKIFSLKRQAYVETSIWDVQPELTGLEHWPYAIPEIILYDFIFKD